MKKLIAFIILLLPLSIFAQTARVSGTLKNIKDTINKVYIYYYAKGKQVADSANIINHKYSFALKIKEPVRVQLLAKNTENKKQRISRRNIVNVYLEPGNITITSIDSFYNIKVAGSKSQVENEKLMAQLKPYNDQIENLNRKYIETEAKKTNKKEEIENIEKSMASIEDGPKKAILLKYVKQNPASPISVNVLSQYAGYNINPSKVEPLFNALSAKNKNSESGKEFAAKIETAKKLEVGKFAIDFTQTDTLGNPVTLSSFKGKYILLDFWASWCGPCRAENPNVVKAYNKFKDKNFTVLSVSLDRPGDKDKWLKAIHDDKLTWAHVSDLQFWNNAVAKTYGIQAIPSNLLLDKDGKIIGKNLHGEDLENKLKEIL